MDTSDEFLHFAALLIAIITTKYTLTYCNTLIILSRFISKASTVLWSQNSSL